MCCKLFVFEFPWKNNGTQKQVFALHHGKNLKLTKQITSFAKALIPSLGLLDGNQALRVVAEWTSGPRLQKGCQLPNKPSNYKQLSSESEEGNRYELRTTLLRLYNAQ